MSECDRKCDGVGMLELITVGLLIGLLFTNLAGNASVDCGNSGMDCSVRFDDGKTWIIDRKAGVCTPRVWAHE